MRQVLILDHKKSPLIFYLKLSDTMEENKNKYVCITVKKINE